MNVEDKIISLCYVSKRNEKSTELCRIADYVDGDFDPYEFSIGTEFYDTDRDLIYGSSYSLQVEPESIGVFEWRTFLYGNDWRTETMKAANVSWQEVIYTQFQKMNQLIEVLRTGFPMDKGFDRQHDLILCCESLNDKCDAVYIHAEDAVCREKKLFLQDTVITLPRILLDARYATGDCKCRYSPSDSRKYLARKDAIIENGRVEVKSREIVVGEIIRKNIGKDSLGRKERQAAKAGLEKLDMPSIIDQIAAIYECGKDQAEAYANEQIHQYGIELDQDTSMRLVQLIVENDTGMAQRVRAEIQGQWEAEQKEAIMEAENRKLDVQRDLESLQQKVNEARKNLSTLQEEQEKMMNLQKNIASEIQERLGQFKKDYAAALVDNAMFLSLKPFFAGMQENSFSENTSEKNEQENGQSGTVMNEADTLDSLPETEQTETEDSAHIEDPEEEIMFETETSTLEENLSDAVEFWKLITDTPSHAKRLTLLTFAAYARKQPLLVVGEGAVDIAELISSSICGQPSIMVSMNGMITTESIQEKINSRPDAVVCVVDGLQRDYSGLRELMRLNPSREFIITEEHAESLSMEPASLFLSFIPIFTDYFYTGEAVGELPNYNCVEELGEKKYSPAGKGLKETRGTIAKWFSSKFVPPIIFARCAKLLSSMCSLDEMTCGNRNDAMAAGVEFLLVPLMKCLGHEDVISDQLNSCSALDEETISALLKFNGVEEN